MKFLDFLQDRRIGVAGTVRKRFSKISEELSLKENNDTLDWSSPGFVAAAYLKLSAIFWINNGSVNLITTVHQMRMGHQIEQMRIRPRHTVTNGTRMRSVFEDSAAKTMLISTEIGGYNHHMEGLDIANQLQPVYIFCVQTKEHGRA